MCVERYPLFNIHEHHGQVVSSILLKNRRSLTENSVAGKDAVTERIWAGISDVSEALDTFKKFGRATF